MLIISISDDFDLRYAHRFLKHHTNDDLVSFLLRILNMLYFCVASYCTVVNLSSLWKPVGCGNQSVAVADHRPTCICVTRESKGVDKDGMGCKRQC